MATEKKAARNWWNDREDDDDDNSDDSDEIDNSAMFDTEAHEGNVEEVSSWWGINKHAELESKKLRRQKHKEENTNFNKVNKVIVGKGDTKRFYTKPTTSWSQLVSNDMQTADDDDEVIEEQMAEAAIDDGENEYRIDEEDVECASDEEEETMWDVDDSQLKLKHTQNDDDADIDGDDGSMQLLDDAATTDGPFMQNGKYVLPLNENECKFYRHETDQRAMWSEWYRNKNYFSKMAMVHYQWAQNKKTKADMERLIMADGGPVEAENNDKHEHEFENDNDNKRNSRKRQREF